MVFPSFSSPLLSRWYFRHAFFQPRWLTLVGIQSVAADHCSQAHVTCDKRNAIGIAVGVVSVAFSLGQVILLRAAPSVAQVAYSCPSPFRICLPHWIACCRQQVESSAFSSSWSGCLGLRSTRHQKVPLAAPVTVPMATLPLG